jgi:hypothetical protein
MKKLFQLFNGLLMLILALTLSTMTATAQGGTSAWITPLNFSESPETDSGYPIILCDTGQNLHVFWIEKSDTDAYIYYRTDAGGSLSPPFDVVRAGSNASTRLSAVIDTNNVMHLTWITNVGNGDFYYATAPLDQISNAQAWSEPIVLVPAVSSGGLTIDNRGRIYASYTQTDNDALVHAGYYMYSDDNGATWSTPVEFFEANTPVPTLTTVSVKADDQGRLHATWRERSYEYGAHSRVGYMRSTDDGVTWSKLVLAEANTPPGVDRAEVYLMGDDEVHLTWFEPDRMHQWSKDGGATWSRPNLIINLGWGFGGSNELVKDSAGIIHDISGVSEGVYHTSWVGNNWVYPEIIAKVDNDPHEQKVVVCRGNELHVVYSDRVGEHEIWYSTKRVAGPAIARGPVPTPIVAVAARAVAPVVETATPIAAQEVADISTGAQESNAPLNTAPPSNTSTMLVLAIAILPVLALIAGVFALKFRRG